MSQLTYQQLKQLTHDYEQLAAWTAIRHFCDQVYGAGKAARVELETYGEYNDEGGTDYRVESLCAYDAHGDALSFDLSLPFWVYLRAQQDDEDQEEDEDYRQAAALDMLKEWWPCGDEENALVEAHQWVEWRALPCDEHTGASDTYDLTCMPSISFPVVVALPSVDNEAAGV